ncbi:MAG: hypothetical protein DRP30_06035 [Thermotoga sp.]|nr:MAG: hypothetical protein DRP30_06035 [Thermotoga sp.]HDM70481.1 type II toxin-antitoxin system HicA family toxin [Thermotogales bacterium]
MKLPRDITGEELVKVLKQFGYEKIRQTGSHVRLISRIKNKPHKITIPLHKPLKTGTLNNILNDVARYFEISKEELIEKICSQDRIARDVDHD